MRQPIVQRKVFAIRTIQWKDTNANAVPDFLGHIVKKLTHAHQVHVQIMVFALIYPKGMKEIRINVYVHMVSNPYLLLTHWHSKNSSTQIQLMATSQYRPLTPIVCLSSNIAAHTHFWPPHLIQSHAILIWFHFISFLFHYRNSIKSIFGCGWFMPRGVYIVIIYLMKWLAQNEELSKFFLLNVAEQRKFIHSKSVRTQYCIGRRNLYSDREWENWMKNSLCSPFWCPSI